MEWISIWDKEPPRNQEILFSTGDGVIHYGELQGYEKLRKCIFFTYYESIDYDCDTTTPFESRVILWLPIPEIPEVAEDGMD